MVIAAGPLESCFFDIFSPSKCFASLFLDCCMLLWTCSLLLQLDVGEHNESRN